MSIRSIGLVPSGNQVVDQQLKSIRGFRLVTADLGRLTRFYRDILGFAVEGPMQPIAVEEMELLGLTGQGKRQILTIGRQNVALDAFEVAGRPYPDDSDSSSLWFQHLAFVVVDIAEAYARLGNATPISVRGPQQLPPASGGVQAFKFRDPDGHPLELLQFPPASVPTVWRNRRALPPQIALGIDHSAISVGDANASTAFYSTLGLKSGKTTYNVGSAQERLDGLRHAEVKVIPMTSGIEPPHLELLAYRVSPGLSAAILQPNDVTATRIVWQGSRAELFRDPDGHLHQVEALGLS